MTFTSTKITGSGSDYEVTGDLTIKGVTQAGDVRPRGRRRRAGSVGQHEGRVHVDRLDQPQGLRVEYNAVLESGGLIVGDKVTIEIDVEATLQKPEA